MDRIVLARRGRSGQVLPLAAAEGVSSAIRATGVARPVSFAAEQGSTDFCPGSEEIVGRAIAAGRRDDLVLAIKAGPLEQVVALARGGRRDDPRGW
ncbi:hypothetical protein ABZ215_28715 [Amycolatopsis sp. NPDC006131]|uniref:hypothetical protein n=1 Tax=Amycolatopsis sp. NPDC006131 TaxID=3156731 RepID=UPI0033AD829F